VVGQRVDPTLLWDVVRLGGNQQQAAFGTVRLAARLIDMFGQRAERSLDLVLYGLLPDGRPFAGMTLREAAERFAAEIGDDWRAPRRLTELLAGPGDQEPWRDWFGRLVHEATPAVAGAIAYGVPGVDVNAIIRWLEWVATAADLTPAAAAGAGVRWGDHDGARVLTDMARVGAASFFPALQQVAASPPPQDVTTAWQQAQRRPARALQAYLHYRGAPVAEDIPAPAVDAPRPASRGLALRAVLDNTLTALLDLQEADRILSGSAPRSGREPIRSGRLRESIGAIRQAWLMVDAELDRLGTVRSDEGVGRSVDEAADLFGLYQANPPRTHLDDEAGRRAHEAAMRAVVEFEELRRQLSAAAGPDVPPGPGRWFDRPPQGPQPITPGSPRGPDGGPRQPAAAASEPSRQVLDRIAATLDGLEGAFVAGESVLWVGLCRAAQPLVGALAADVAARLGRSARRWRGPGLRPASSVVPLRSGSPTGSRRRVLGSSQRSPDWPRRPAAPAPNRCRPTWRAACATTWSPRPSRCVPISLCWRRLRTVHRGGARWTPGPGSASFRATASTGSPPWCAR
jgi:hypothetical protein